MPSRPLASLSGNIPVCPRRIAVRRQLWDLRFRGRNTICPGATQRRGLRRTARRRPCPESGHGLLLAVMVTAASVTDRDAGQTLLVRLRERHWRVTRVWADGGYTGRLVDFARGVLRVALTVVRRSDDTSGFTVLPKRWLVERTFAWLMHSRRLARDYETRTDTSEAGIEWAMSMVMSRRLARRAR
ncbi:transposase [Streptomyces violaceorubidus]